MFFAKAKPAGSNSSGRLLVLIISWKGYLQWMECVTADRCEIANASSSKSHLEEDSSPELNTTVGEIAVASGDLSEVCAGDGSGGLAEVGEIEDVAEFAAELDLHALMDGEVAEEMKRLRCGFRDHRERCSERFRPGLRLPHPCRFR